MSSAEPAQLRRSLLSWYDVSGRNLPWRTSRGEQADPYQVWISEIMLQQTRVTAVIPYFMKFFRLWPNVTSLAEANLDDVLSAWAGLGYYARARNMHRCAGIITTKFGGKFPSTEEELLSLPGIGAYTAAAIRAIAFDKPAVVVDVNIERVIARLYNVREPISHVKPQVRRLASSLMSSKRPGDWAQALMDLGATVCKPKSPDCDSCPWKNKCVAKALGSASKIPLRLPKPKRPTRYGVAFVLTRSDGCILFERRPQHGILGGMLGLPGTPWMDRHWVESDAIPFSPLQTPWSRVTGVVRHTFTHFHLELTLLKGRIRGATNIHGHWVKPSEFLDIGLPTLMKKAVKLGQTVGT